MDYISEFYYIYLLNSFVTYYNQCFSMVNDYIIPLFLRNDISTYVGSAFLVNDYIITAGHVVSDFRIYHTKIGGEMIQLSPFDWVVRRSPDENHPQNDMAIYRIDGLESPLELSSESPKSDTEAKVICWQKDGDGIIQKITNSLILNVDYDNYFYKIATLDRITHGASGCPVLQGNKVIGMLTQGVVSCSLNTELLFQEGLSSQDIANLQVLNNNMCYILRPELIYRAVIEKCL